MNIRRATVADVPEMLRLITELAVFEKAGDAMQMTEAVLRHDGFERKVPGYIALIAEDHSQVVGMALCCFHYSTWRGQRLYLEDLIVTDSQRGKGTGAALLDAVRQLALEHHCTGVNWQVLDWNEGAIRFYERLGVQLDAQWINCFWHVQSPQPPTDTAVS
jgi:GNAT superfamily N-acetyltransferase